MFKKITLFLCIISIAFVSKAQEGLRPMTANVNYLYNDLKVSEKTNINLYTARTSTNPIQLPFIEDFFYAQSNSYPSQDLWSDSSVYINTGFPIAPPSIGVATFDGLNKNGYPYLPNLINLSLSLPADTLTSKPINLFTSGSQTLQVSDSIALSFLYQARGNGDNPEITDTLLVDFYNPISAKWTNVWFKRGNSSSNTNDTIFQRAFIWVDESAYLNNNFKFRFRNKATVAGNYDHWHIDYVKLDKYRSQLGDTTYNDLTFGYLPTPLLKNYSEMPWQQYIPSEMAIKQSVKIRNNDNNAIFSTYSNSVVAGFVSGTNNYNGGQTNLGTFKTTGWNNTVAHANPPINFTISPLTDSAEIKIRHIVTRAGASTDFSSRNDTVIQRQYLKNYFAYDDGTCEQGYYVLGQGGRMALKFTLNFTDTLRSVRIYFDPVGSLNLAQSNYKFRINLWANGSFGPGVTLYRDSVRYPIYYNTAHNTYADYTLTTKQVLSPGSYFIGIQQQVATGITVGFDSNLDHRQNLFYDSGSGWNQSAYYGSLMLRPVFGAKIITVGLKENNIQPNYKLVVYPNQADDFITIKLETLPINPELKIINTLGQTLVQSAIFNTQSSLNVSNLQNGIYYLVLQSNKQTIQTQKIIIQH
jgi:hypothetical protein